MTRERKKKKRTESWCNWMWFAVASAVYCNTNRMNSPAKCKKSYIKIVTLQNLRRNRFARHFCRSGSSISIKTSHPFWSFCWKMTLQIFVIGARRKTTIDIQSCGFITSVQGFQCIQNMKSTCASSLSTFNLLNLNNIEPKQLIEDELREWEREKQIKREKLWAFMYIQSADLNTERWMFWCGCHNTFSV